MTRIARVYFNNAVYHVTIRGNNRQAVLKRDDDKVAFLNSLAKFKSRFKFKLYAFVLMDNHAHLIIGTIGIAATISKIMQAVCLSYSIKFRKKHKYTGYVWQGRFKSNIIDGEKYIFACIEYIHNNPTRAGVARRACDYMWSSYRFYNDEKSRISKFIGIDELDL